MNYIELDEVGIRGVGSCYRMKGCFEEWGVGETNL